MATEKAMTEREFLTAISNLDTVPAPLREYATNRLAKKDEAAAARKSKPTKAQAEAEPYIPRIIEYLTGADEPVATSTIATAMELSTAKVSPICRRMVEAGQLIEHEVKVKGGRKVKGYTVAAE